MCVFASNSPATGCRIDVVRGSTIVQFNIIMRQDDSNSVEGCVTDISSGTYEVLVYDTISNTPVTVYSDVIVSDIATTYAVSATTSRMFIKLMHAVACTEILYRVGCMMHDVDNVMMYCLNLLWVSLWCRSTVNWTFIIYTV